MSVSLDDIYQPLNSSGAPFYGILRTESMVKGYPLNISPDYQRGHIWTVEQSSKFIGHMLEGGQVAHIIVNSGPNGCAPIPEVIDGKQRITACIGWSNNKFPALLYDGREIWARDLDQSSRVRCRNMIGMQYALVRLNRKQCLELYIKLNRGGTVHTDDEINRVKRLLDIENDNGA